MNQRLSRIARDTSMLEASVLRSFQKSFCSNILLTMKMKNSMSMLSNGHFASLSLRKQKLIQNKIRALVFNQFEQLDALVPRTPEYAYLDMVRTNKWAGNLSLRDARLILKEWRTGRRNPAAVSLGTLGGKSKSRAKIKAAKLNGKKGGRPKKLIGDNK